MDILKKYLPYLLAFLLGFIAGYFFCQKTTEPVTIDKPPIIKTEYKTQTKTEVVYVPKEPGEKTDIDASIGKQDLKVVVNGREAVIQKLDSEDYVLQQGKLELTQSSTAKLDITVPTIDKTKRWGIGAGFGNNGIGYAITFPVSKKNNNLDGWAYHDNDTTAAGIMIRF